MLRRLRPWASLRANSGRSLRRHLPVRAVAFLVLALAAVVVITAGSAATTTKPYTATFDPGPLAAAPWSGPQGQEWSRERPSRALRRSPS
jgi:hypothetical protein